MGNGYLLHITTIRRDQRTTRLDKRASMCKIKFGRRKISPAETSGPRHDDVQLHIIPVSLSAKKPNPCTTTGSSLQFPVGNVRSNRHLLLSRRPRAPRTSVILLCDCSLWSVLFLFFPPRRLQNLKCFCFFFLPRLPTGHRRYSRSETVAQGLCRATALRRVRSTDDHHHIHDHLHHHRPV